MILASQSPRRKELLKLAGFDFTVEVSDAPETADPSLTPAQLVEGLAQQKANAVAQNHPDEAVVGADTVVVLQGKVLGKPKDREDAVRMLGLLSGREHEVYTGVCIVCGGREKRFHVCTRVKFYPLTRQEIDDYVTTGEPMDKAGAYGIQGKGCTLVESIVGDYYNVVGFPIARFVREIKAMHNS